jgi:hypothetical protein
LVSLVYPTVANAQTGDNFEPGDTGWRGLSGFVEVGSARGIDLQSAETLDYSSLTADDRLVIVHPTSPLDVGELSEFVVNGGRILLADDFGESTRLLERLDIRRTADFPAGYPHQSFLGGNEAAPMFSPQGVHPLLEGVDRLVANHPAVLEHAGGPVVPYSGRGGLVFDMNLEAGKVIVVGDSSLFINHMLSRADNRRFASNALAYLCDGIENCSPRLLTGYFTQTGQSDADDGEGGWDALLSSANDRVAEAMEQFPASPLMYYLAVLLTIGMAAYLATVLSIRQPPTYSSYIEETLEEIPEPQSEFEWNLSRFASKQRANLALPAAMLKEIVERAVLEELGVWDEPKSERPSLEALAERIVERARQQPQTDAPSRREVVDTLSQFARVPTRDRVFLDSDAYFSQRDLLQLYRRAQTLLRILGREEEYERRTRTLVGEPEPGESGRGRSTG